MTKMGILGVAAAALASLGAITDRDMELLSGKDHPPGPVPVPTGPKKTMSKAEKNWRGREPWQRKKRAIQHYAARVPAELPTPLTRQLRRQMERHAVKRLRQAENGMSAPGHHHAVNLKG
jgi:hypothetical protein